MNHVRVRYNRIQIAARGRQNAVLNDNPAFTLFKTQHNRYASFAEDYERNDFTGVISFGASKCPAIINRYGDLISDVHLQVTLPPIGPPADGAWNSYVVQVPDPANPGQTIPQTRYHPSAAHWVNAIGYAMIDEVILEIGSAEIDTLYGDYLFLWEELTQRPGARVRESVGRFDWTDTVESDMIEFAKQERTLMIQLPFFFSKYFLEKGLSLPLVALTFHEVRVKVSFAPLSDLVCVIKQTRENDDFIDMWTLEESGANSIPINRKTNAPLANNDLVASLLITYIYLDAEERNTFANQEHEMLITCLQRQTNSVATTGLVGESIKLYFNHPSNFLLWTVRPQNWRSNAGRRRYSVGFKDRFDYSKKVASVSYPYGDVADPIKSATLTLNSHPRWPENTVASFFRVQQPLLKFENVPSSYLYVFVFAIAGGVYQPTSTLNFSRVENAQLQLTYNNEITPIPPSDLTFLVENYNLLEAIVMIWFMAVPLALSTQKVGKWVY